MADDNLARGPVPVPKDPPAAGRTVDDLIGMVPAHLVSRVRDVVSIVSELVSLADDVSLAERYSELRRNAERVPGSGRTDTAVALGVVALREQLGIDPYPVQIAAALSLTAGGAAELETGEGKTIVGYLAACALALDGSVHVCTANTYLTTRDRNTLAPAFAALGLRSGSLTVAGHPRRAEAYRSDVVFAPLSIIGFDLLNDRAATHPSMLAVGPRHALIVDEADAVLLDDAVTPISRSVEAQETTAFVDTMAAAVETLTNHDVIVAEDSILLTTDGAGKLAAVLGVDDFWNDHDTVAYAMAALAARFVYRRDREYLVADGTVAMLHEQTGRASFGRRTRGGVHEAIEAREALLGTEVVRSRRPVVVDSVTVAELVGGYRVVAAMSGTLSGDAVELEHRYGLRVLVFPTQRPSRRIELNDVVHPDSERRTAEVVTSAMAYADAGHPVLVAASTLPKAEAVADALRAAGADPALVTARSVQNEAVSFASAGTPGKITVTTAIAGRGVDIVLGGADATERRRAVDAGGLVVIGVGRFASSRLDRQLIGRCARQGDPGVAVFHLALDDENIELPAILRDAVMSALVVGPGDVSALPAITRRITIAQSVHDEVMRDARRRASDADVELRGQRSAYLRLRNHLLTAPRTEMTATICGPGAERAAVGSAVETKIRHAVTTAGNDDLDDVVDRALRHALLSALDDEWSRHLQILDVTRYESTLAALTQLDTAVAYAHAARDRFTEFSERMSRRTRSMLEAFQVDVEENRVKLRLR